MDQISLMLDALKTGLGLAFEFWWVWLPIVLGIIAYDSWFAYQKQKYLSGLKWTILEVIPPPDVPFSTAKAAENIFSGLHTIYSGGINWKTQFFQGKIPTWVSFEIVSNGGETHFYIRCTQDQRNGLEVLIFSQYPDAEIRVVPDYVDLLPAKLDLAQYDVSGTEFAFTKEAAYPIRTYPEFEEAGGKDEYARLDPLAPLMEIMSALHPGEYLWLQYILRATGGDWVKEGAKVTDKIKGKKEEVKPSMVETIILFPFNLIGTIIGELVGAAPEVKKEEKKEEFNLGKLTAGEKDVLEKVEHKLAKLAFKAGLRVLYTARKDVFNASRPSSVTGMFKQLFANNLNSFKPAGGTRDKGMFPWMFPSDKGFFADERTAKKKHGMYGMYRGRMFPFAPPLIFNTEELATLWHLPAINVRAPLMPRVQAKKGQPPSILPTR